MMKLRDIARKAQVSEATVSRVINNYPYVKEETRQRVLSVIEKNNFKPNQIARGMRIKKTHTIGLLIANITNPFYAEAATTVMNIADQYGYTVIICITNNDPQKQEEYIKILQQRKVDGFLFGSVLLKDPYVKGLIKSGVPYVLFNRIFKNNDGINYVSLDNKLGLSLLVEHLVSLGHKRIAFIRGCQAFSTSEERYQGYISTLNKLGLEYKPEFVIEGESNEEISYRVTKKLLDEKHGITAIIAANDLMALSALEAISRCNLRVPEDIALVGFHDIEIAKHQSIQLTTVGHNTFKMSEIATQSLIQLIEGNKNLVQVVLKPQLLIRRTCGAQIK